MSAGLVAADGEANEREFLEQVRRRLGAREKSAHPGRWAPRAPRGDNPRSDRLGEGQASSGRDVATGLAALAERFIQELIAVGGHAEVVADPEALRERLTAVRARSGLRTLVWDDDPRWHAAEGQWLAAVQGSGFEISLATAKEAAAGCDAGITWVDWGVAETGSLVLVSAHGRVSLASLLPWTHIALLPSERIVATRAELLARLREEAALQASPLSSTRWPAHVVFITGPSRTADIENDLSIGVHGPGALHVFVLPPV